MLARKKGKVFICLYSIFLFLEFETSTSTIGLMIEL